MELLLPIVAVIIGVAVLFLLLNRFQPSITKFMRASAAAEDSARRVIAPNPSALLTVEDEILARFPKQVESFSAEEKVKLAGMTLEQRFDYYETLEKRFDPKASKNHWPQSEPVERLPRDIEEMFEAVEGAVAFQHAVEELKHRAYRTNEGNAEALSRELALIENVATRIRMKRGY